MKRKKGFPYLCQSCGKKTGSGYGAKTFWDGNDPICGECLKARKRLIAKPKPPKQERPTTSRSAWLRALSLAQWASGGTGRRRGRK